MNDVFDRIMNELNHTFRRLERQIAPPVEHEHNGGIVFRYVEQTPQQAMLQKFARVISGLHCCRLLLTNGFLQELGVIQRTLDDFVEDIMFFTYGVINSDMTEHHKLYLRYHWMEESEGDTGNRGQVPRKHIRSYVARHSGNDPSSMISAGRAIYKGYSGFVHGSAEVIMDMCTTDPPRYFLAGMLQSPLYDDHRVDLWNYMYRGFTASVFMARMFGDQALADKCFRSIRKFEDAYRDIIFGLK